MRLTFLKNKEVKNAGWIMGGHIIQMVLSLFVGVITARYLGPSNYGLISYAASFTAFFTSLCTLGLNSILVKEFIENPEEEGKIIGSALFMRAISSFCSALIIVLIVSVVDAGEKTTITVVALCSIGVLFHIFETLKYWFQSHLNSKVTAMVALIAYVIMAVYKIALLILGKNVKYFAFATSVDYICVAVLLLIAYYKNGGRKLEVSLNTSKRMIKQSYHYIISGLMTAIYAQTDKLMLKQMLGTTEVGYYATATAICSMWVFILSAIIDSLRPSIIAAYSKDKTIFLKRNKQLYAIVFYISLFVSLMFQIFAPLVIRILYGQAYLPSVTPLRVVTWYTAFSYLGVARNPWIVCEGKQKYLKYIYSLAAIINVILNFMFIPLLGAAGAALASLISQMFTSIILPYFIKELRPNAKLMLEAIFLKGIKKEKYSCHFLKEKL